MAIHGYSELLLMDTPEVSHLKEKIVNIQEGVDRIAMITKKLMQITKYETIDYLNGKIIDIDGATE